MQKILQGTVEAKYAFCNSWRFLGLMTPFLPGTMGVIVNGCPQQQAVDYTPHSDGLGFDLVGNHGVSPNHDAVWGMVLSPMIVEVK
jgi:hypothetical protein